MQKTFLILTAIIFCFALNAQQPRVISDCTIYYIISHTGKAKQDTAATSIVYIKGKEIKIELANKLFNQTIFYNENSGNATILKTIGESKYIANYNSEEWKKENKNYEGATLSITGNTKKILDYNCKEAILTLKNGKMYTVYFTPAIIPSVRQTPFEFIKIPGLILEYESTAENEKISYKADSINFNPVPSFQFEIPKTGYRILH